MPLAGAFVEEAILGWNPGVEAERLILALGLGQVDGRPKTEGNSSSSKEKNSAAVGTNCPRQRVVEGIIEGNNC